MAKKHNKNKDNQIREKQPSLFLIFCILSGLALVLLGRFLVTDKMIFGHDLKMLAFYLNSYAREFLVNFKAPLWLTGTFGGMPLLASMNAIIYYPTELIYTFLKLPIEIGFNYDFVIHIILAGFSMYIFTKSIGMQFRGALFSSIVFMFSGSLLTIMYAGHINTVKAVSLIPLFFYFLEKGLKHSKLRYFSFAGLVFGLQFLALGMQVIAYMMLIALFYFMLRIFTNPPVTIEEDKKYARILKFAIYGIVMVIVGIGISAIQLFPSYEYLQISHRGKPSYEFFTSWSFHPTESITFLIPEFFGLKERTFWGHNLFCLATDYLGVFPLILTFVAVLFLYKNRIALFFILTSVFCLIMSYGGYTPIYKLLYYVPVFSSFRNPTRFLILFTFSISVVSGFGLQFLLDEGKRITDTKRWKLFRNILIGFLCIVFIVILLSSVYQDKIISYMQNLSMIKAKFGSANLGLISEELYNIARNGIVKLFIFAVLSAIIIFICLREKTTAGKNIVLFLAILVLLVDVWIVDSQFLKTYDIRADKKDDAAKFLLENDKTLYRVVPLGNLFNKNTYAENGLSSIGGYHGLPVYRYTNILEKVGINYINLLNILNTKYAVSIDKIEHPQFKLVYDGQTKVYENSGYFPRAYFANKITKYDDIEQLFIRLKDQSFLPQNEVLFDDSELKSMKLQTPDMKTDVLSGLNQDIKITSYSSNVINISVKSHTDNMLVLSEVYTPNWKAKIDGALTPVYPSYGLLRSVYVPRGEHKIEFFYDGKSFYIGAIISIITFLLLIASFIFMNRDCPHW